MTFLRLTAVWLALSALLALTVGASFVLHGEWSVMVGLGIALAKAALVFWFFMRLKDETGLVRIFAVGAAIWLVLLLLFSSGDYVTRGAW
jgi:cytochrome c oxidase subunit 4